MEMRCRREGSDEGQDAKANRERDGQEKVGLNLKMDWSVF